MVTASGQAEIDLGIREKELLDKVNAKILCIVLNKVDLNEGNNYYKFLHYYYE